MKRTNADSPPPVDATSGGGKLDEPAASALVRSALAEVLPRKKRGVEFSPSARLFQDIGLDSMQVLAFTFALEQRLGVTLPEAEVKREPIESLEQIVALIMRLQR